MSNPQSQEGTVPEFKPTPSWMLTRDFSGWSKKALRRAATEMRDHLKEAERLRDYTEALNRDICAEGAKAWERAEKAEGALERLEDEENLALGAAVERADRAEAALAERDQQVRALADEFWDAIAAIEAENPDAPERSIGRVIAYRDAAERVRSLALTQPSSTPLQQDPEVPRCGGSGKIYVSGSGNPYDEDPVVEGDCPGCGDCLLSSLRTAVTELQATMFLTGSPPKDQDEALAKLAGVVDALLAAAPTPPVSDCQSTPELLGEGLSEGDRQELTRIADIIGGVHRPCADPELHEDDARLLRRLATSARPALGDSGDEAITATDFPASNESRYRCRCGAEWGCPHDGVPHPKDMECPECHRLLPVRSGPPLNVQVPRDLAARFITNVVQYITRPLPHPKADGQALDEMVAVVRSQFDADDLAALTLTQPVPGNSGGVEEGR
jgi:hypothetical protein